MGKIVDHIEGMECALCGCEAADLYSCDRCGQIFCEFCAPYREDDVPVDWCGKCIGLDHTRPSRVFVDSKREMTANDIVERIMTAHWDMAACRCWVCTAGREQGLRPREKWLGVSKKYPVPTGDWGEQ